ncbi:hypothetical protein ACIBH1_32325 [Nonomuraea sp. NPDC050663]|uniref:hypothetical protein n=1 Tax=Nonomuraea sp. NPDC050663 TaxID=3364370 RepID=UPI0037A56A8A
MLVVLAIAAAAVLVCVVLVSLGKGGELTEFPPDIPPLELPEPGQLSAVDFMALQLPVNLVGYHTQSVDETLRRAANAISARDTRIAVLEQRVSELLSSRLQARQEVHAGPGDALRTQHEPRPSDASLVLSEAEPAVRGLGIEPYGRHATAAGADAEPVELEEDATAIRLGRHVATPSDAKSEAAGDTRSEAAGDSDQDARQGSDRGSDQNAQQGSDRGSESEPEGSSSGADVSAASSGAPAARTAGKSRWDDEPEADAGPGTAAADTIDEHDDERVSAEDRR